MPRKTELEIQLSCAGERSHLHLSCTGTQGVRQDVPGACVLIVSGRLGRTAGPR